MSLDITIKQNDKVIHSSNFYGFTHYNSSYRLNLAKSSGYELVKDYSTFKDWIDKQVCNKEKQRFYLDLITDQNAKITVEIY